MSGVGGEKGERMFSLESKFCSDVPLLGVVSPLAMAAFRPPPPPFLRLPPTDFLVGESAWLIGLSSSLCRSQNENRDRSLPMTRIGC